MFCLILGMSSTLCLADGKDHPEHSMLGLMDLSLEELGQVRSVTSTASKKEEDINQAPGIVTVISAKDVASYGANTINDVLLRLPNVYTWGTSILSNNVTSIRGQTLTQIDNHVLILINGRPSRDNHAGGHHEPIYQSFPLEAIERIEVIRGPGSVLYGTNAFSGVINIITKKAIPEGYSSLTAGLGDDGTQFTSGVYGKQIKDVDFMVSGRVYDTDGWNFSAVDELGVAGSADYKRRNLGLYAQAEYKALKIQGYIVDQDMTALGIRPRFPAVENTFSLNRRFADVQYIKDISDDWSATFNFTFNGFGLTNEAGLETVYDDYFYETTVKGTVFDNVNLGYVTINC
jgi:outer membrane receptor protein involved in Fe transport